jgi:putative transposase
MCRHAILKPRYGYRRIRVLLMQEGLSMSKEKALRLWRKAGLLQPRKRPRKNPARSASLLAAHAINDVWAYDFVHDGCANGQQLKCLTVIDEYSREALAIEVDGSVKSERVIEVLSRLISERGLPRAIRSDNGPEFVAHKVSKWAKSLDLQMLLIEPGKPWQNGINESFNGKFRDECLSVEWFRNRREAGVIIEQWREEYNTRRPHSSLGNMPPAEYSKRESARHGPCTPDIVAYACPEQGPRRTSRQPCNLWVDPNLRWT